MVQLEQWVPEKVCLSCNGCCRYAQKTTVWSPLFLFEEIRELTEKNILPSCLFTHSANIIKKAARINLLADKGMFFCPCFNALDHRCKIYAHRPFDCQFYPFLLARKGKRAFLALDERCPYARKTMETSGINSYIQKLCEFIISEDFVKMMADEPEMIQDYGPDIKFILPLPH